LQNGVQNYSVYFYDIKFLKLNLGF